MSRNTIAVLATLDTKGREAEFLRDQIHRHGQKALVIDVGVTGTPADVRLNGTEMAAVGRDLARRLQSTHRPAVFMVPAAGFDSYAVKGGGFYDPESDAVFVRELKAHLPSSIRVEEQNTHIDDPAFATEAAHTLI